jgi:uncharacterized protein (TIGR03435 family)
MAGVYAQSPAFDVVSVKLQPWDGQGSVGVTVRGNTLIAEHSCLYDLVEFAYEAAETRVSGGPSWAMHAPLAGATLYQVRAKTMGDHQPTMDEFRLMTRALLADRFRLRVHYADQNTSAYNLVVAKQGSKLRESLEDTKFSLVVDARPNHGRSRRITATHVGLVQLLDRFERYAGRPLSDRSGLKGFYDFELEWDADVLGEAPPEGDERIGQSYSTALEKQLGLRLEAGTASIRSVVIDGAEKASEN